MKFMPISISQIRPYVRFVISTGALVHSLYVVPFEQRIIYVEKGKGSLWVDGKFYKMQTNNIFYVSSGVPYKVKAEKDSSIIVVYLDLTMENYKYRERIKPIGIVDEKNIPEYLSKKFICNYRLVNKNEEIRFMHSAKSFTTISFLKQILKSFNNGSELNDQVISGMCVSLISKILEEKNIHHNPLSTDAIVDKTIEYITKNYSKNISLEDISKEFGFHKNYLNFRFKKETGFSIYKYLIEYRLKQSMKFLIYTNMPVSEIAENVGFKDSKNFSVIFKKYYLVSPSVIRKQMLSSERMNGNE